MTSSLQKVSLALLFAGVVAAAPPPTAQKPVTETLHGVTLTDPYRWLEDQNSSETRAWLEAQAAYTDKAIEAMPGREALQKRFAPFFRIDSVSVPRLYGKRYIFTRRLADENRSSIVMREAVKGPDVVLKAPQAVSADETTSIGIQDVSDDGKLLAYWVRRGGEDEVEVRFFDVDARKDLTDIIPRGRYFGFGIGAGNRKVYYSRVMTEGTRVFVHEMGTDPASDKVFFGMGKGRVPFDSISVSDDGKWLLHSLGTGSSSRNELRIFDLEKGTGPAVVAAGLDAQFTGQVVGEKLYVGTNWKAPNRRLLVVDARNPAIENAKEVIAEREWVMSGARVTGGKLFASYLENVQTKVRVFSLDGKAEGEVAAPGVGVLSGPMGRLDSTEAFLVYSSFDEPGSIWRYDVKTGARELWWRSSVPVKPGEIEVKQVWYNSKDGTKVPMWLVHKKGLVLDGNRPVYLTGYGGFNLSRLPSFTPAAVVWSQLDGVYALPNLRGGGEFGEKWHKAGMLENKQNVFDDFIGAAEWLIANKYTKPSRLAIAGGSNGGLLVGAALTQRPELFGAVVCSVPLLDMVRYHDLLLGRFWVTEYGSAEKPDQFKYLLKYSPYHRVEKGTKYPAVLFVTGDLDTRVDPMHARKMAALMQSATGSDKPVMLKYDTKSGHSGGKPVAQQIEEIADAHLFALRALGVEVK